MRRVRWIVAAILILAMVMLNGCSGRGTVEDSVTDDGNNSGNGGILSDIADGVEDGIDEIRDGMDTIEDDTRTDLGNDGTVGNNGAGGSGTNMTE
ncbi:MAG: hypothetical protein IJ486_11750 [Firmicutes bacterium]|nr:hypothetical protein [Bacillota bacterium]